MSRGRSITPKNHVAMYAPSSVRKEPTNMVYIAGDQPCTALRVSRRKNSSCTMNSVPSAISAVKNESR